MTSHRYKLGETVDLDVNDWCKGWQACIGTVCGVNLDGDPVMIRVDDQTVWDWTDTRVRNIRPHKETP